MPISLTILLASLCSIFRSRAALELENLALRHQIGVLQRSARKRPRLTSGDRLLWVCLCLLWRDWCSALAHRQNRNGRSLASCRLSFVLDREGAARPTGTAGYFARAPRSGPQDVPGESQVGVHPASTANCSNWESTSGRAASVNTWCAAASRRLRLGAHFWRITPSSLSLRISIIITDREPIFRWGRTARSHERFSRRKWGPSWRCRRWVDCITATNDGLREKARTHHATRFLFFGH
jgi:hypothetical protein